MRSTILFVVGCMFAYASAQVDPLHMCWRDMYERGFGGLPTNCGEGKELQAGLCYPPCPEGYYGVGPVCWQSCPSDYTDIGLFCVKGGDIMTKDAKGRGVGSIPKCDPSMEAQLAICYPKCNESYVPYGPTCWLNQTVVSAFPVECNFFMFAKDEPECARIKDVLHEVGLESTQCIAALGDAIIHHHMPTTSICRDLINGVMVLFGETALCSKST